jgi:hypothetical protein
MSTKTFPFKFSSGSDAPTDSFLFNYAFNEINGIIINEASTLPINQNAKIPAFSIELDGKRAYPNVSIKLNGYTKLYTLYNLYITNKCPITTNNDSPNIYSLVIECFSIDDIQKNKLLIFIPIKLKSETTLYTQNKFEIFNSVFSELSSQNYTKITKNSDNTYTSEQKYAINDYIPSLERGSKMYYYEYIDELNVQYDVLFFNSTDSNLFFDQSIMNYFNIKFNNNEENTKYRLENPNETAESSYTLLSTESNPLISTSIEITSSNNIYIDCQPTDLPQENKSFYIKKFDEYSEVVQIGFTYIFLIIFLSVLIFFIYKIGNFFTVGGSNEKELVNNLNNSLQTTSKIIKSTSKPV